jgi:hypothetical protein
VCTRAPERSRHKTSGMLAPGMRGPSLPTNSSHECGRWWSDSWISDKDECLRQTHWAANAS